MLTLSYWDNKKYLLELFNSQLFLTADKATLISTLYNKLLP